MKLPIWPFLSGSVVLETATTAATLPAGAVGRDRGHIFDAADLKQHGDKEQARWPRESGETFCVKPQHGTSPQKIAATSRTILNRKTRACRA